MLSTTIINSLRTLGQRLHDNQTDSRNGARNVNNKKRPLCVDTPEKRDIRFMTLFWRHQRLRQTFPVHDRVLVNAAALIAAGNREFRVYAEAPLPAYD